MQLLAGCLGDAMVSSRPHVPELTEIIYPGEAFSWHEDASVTERRKLRRKTQIWTTCIGAILALLVIGQAVGLSSYMTAAAPAAVIDIP